MDDVRESLDVLAPIVKSIHVDLPVETAFSLFTDQISNWWPLVTHSVGGDKVEKCVLEGWVGGRFYEVVEDGSQSEWGRVLAWEAPYRLALTFYPGRTPEFAPQVEVSFQEEVGGTRLTLVHDGWERCRAVLGEATPAERRGYDSGWEYVLRQFQTYSSNKKVGSA